MPVNLLKHSKSISPVIQFSASKTTHQLATSAREITKLKLISTGGAAHVSVYNNRAESTTDLRWVLDSSLQNNDTDDFTNPLYFDEGIYLVCDDGAAFNPQVCVAYIP